MAKFSINDILIVWKGKYLQVERVSGEIVFCIKAGKGGGFFGLHKTQVKDKVIKKALPIDLGIKLQQIT